ncbi:Uncharacterised protein [uncultured archaeon]|nr:Uncharacterised protein [uncultured archaeon]
MMKRAHCVGCGEIMGLFGQDAYLCRTCELKDAPDS